MAQAHPAQGGFPVDEGTLNDLVAISGATKEQARAALQAAFGDPNRAFEYLTSGFGGGGFGGGAGMGQFAGMDPALAGALNQEMMEDDGYGDEDEGSADYGGNPFEAFASNPGFQQLRARILQSPQFFNEFMQMLQTSQPELHQAIQQNPQAFMQLLLGGGLPAGGGGNAQAHAGHGHGQGAQPGQIRVTQEEMEAIQRL